MYHLKGSSEVSFGSGTSIDTPEREFDELEFSARGNSRGREREREREGECVRPGVRHKFFIRLATPIVRAPGSIRRLLRCRYALSMFRVYNKKDHGALSSRLTSALFDVTSIRLEVTVCDDCH